MAGWLLALGLLACSSEDPVASAPAGAAGEASGGKGGAGGKAGAAGQGGAGKSGGSGQGGAATGGQAGAAGQGAGAGTSGGGTSGGSGVGQGGVGGASAGAGGVAGASAGGGTTAGAGGAAAGAGGAAAGGGGGLSGGSGQGGASSGAAELVGYWLWKQVVHEGKVTTEITEDDLVFKYDADGDPSNNPPGSTWEGCPQGVVCTHYGLMRFAFGADGRFFYTKNVTTSSDFGVAGVFSVEGPVVKATIGESWSCAHPPGGSTGQSAPGFVRYKRVGADLWLALGALGDLASTPPDVSVEPADWIVLRSVSEADFNFRYNVDACPCINGDCSKAFQNPMCGGHVLVSMCAEGAGCHARCALGSPAFP